MITSYSNQFTYNKKPINLQNKKKANLKNISIDLKNSKKIMSKKYPQGIENYKSP
jgi:hypothetical protein